MGFMIILWTNGENTEHALSVEQYQMYILKEGKEKHNKKALSEE